MKITANRRMLQRTANLLVPGDEEPQPPDEIEALLSELVEAGLSKVLQGDKEPESIEVDGLPWAGALTVQPQREDKPAHIIAMGEDPLQGFSVSVRPQSRDLVVVGTAYHVAVTEGRLWRSWVYAEDTLKQLDLGGGPAPTELFGFAIPRAGEPRDVMVARPIGWSRWVAGFGLAPRPGRDAFEPDDCLGDAGRPHLFDTEQEAFDALARLLPPGAAYPDSRLHVTNAQ